MKEEFTLSVGNDAHNWILIKDYKTEKGKQVSKNLAYFPNLKSLLDYATEHLLRVHGLEELEKAMAEMKNLVEATND